MLRLNGFTKAMKSCNKLYLRSFLNCVEKKKQNMSFSVHCCEGFSIKRFLCRCCESTSDDESPTEPKEQKHTATPTARSSVNESIDIQCALSQECRGLVVPEEAEESEIVVFYEDGEEDIRVASVQGHVLLPTEARPSANIHPKLRTVLNDHFLNFFRPIYVQTLLGSYIQMVIRWREQNYLFRTFPTFNNRRSVVGGMSVLTPHHLDMSNSLEKYILKSSPNKEPRDMARRRRKTASYSVHGLDASASGLLPSDIVPFTD